MPSSILLVPAFTTTSRVAAIVAGWSSLARLRIGWDSPSLVATMLGAFEETVDVVVDRLERDPPAGSSFHGSQLTRFDELVGRRTANAKQLRSLVHRDQKRYQSGRNLGRVRLSWRDVEMALEQRVRVPTDAAMLVRAAVSDCGSGMPLHGRSLPTVGSIFCMVKEKATITVDREKLSEARALLGAPSASATIDVALSELIRRHRLRNDLKAYAGTPPTAEEATLGSSSPDWDDLADDTDWDAEWPEGR
jgi:hypothetical protein